MKTINDIRITKHGARDIEEAWMGDYKENYDHKNGSIFTLPEFRHFEERLEDSTFDNMNLESTARRYRFLVPFIIKAELSPGLAFAEVMLTWIQFLTCKLSITSMLEKKVTTDLINVILTIFLLLFKKYMLKLCPFCTTE